MANRSNRWVFAALLALATSAALSNTLLFRQSVQGNTDLARNIAPSLGPWRAVAESPASESEIRGLETRDILRRTYTNGNAYIELVVAYIAHSSRKSAHAQEACLRGSGALVGRIESKQLAKAPVKVKSISLENHDQKQLVYYWYKIGHTYTADYLASSIKMFLGGFTRARNSASQGASLVRLLTPVNRNENQAAVDARLEEFTVFLLPELERNLP